MNNKIILAAVMFLCILMPLALATQDLIIQDDGADTVTVNGGGSLPDGNPMDDGGWSYGGGRFGFM